MTSPSRLIAQAAAHSLPDVIFTADLYVVPFAKAGISIDMEPLAKADPTFDLTDVYENMLALSKVEGKGIYMIPSSYDVVTLYYNKTMFEAAGAPLPTADSTWDDVIASCKIIKEKTDNYCIPYSSLKWWAVYVPWIVGYGGSVLSEDGKTAMLNSPETLAGLEAFTNMWTQDGIGQPSDFDAGGDCFIVGKCALQLTSPARWRACARSIPSRLTGMSKLFLRCRMAKSRAWEPTASALPLTRTTRRWPGISSRACSPQKPRSRSL